MEGDHLAGVGVQRAPYPVAVRFLAHEAPELVELGLQPLQDHCWSAACWLDIEIFRCRLELLTHKLQKPLQTDAHCSADSAQGDSLQ
jgi:hypothetical protein